MSGISTAARLNNKAILMLALVSSSASATAPLVSVASVEPWHQGEVSVINCQISVPFLTAFASESDAKLTYLMPKGSKVKQGQLIAKQKNFYYLQQLTRLQQQLTISKSTLNFNNNEYNRLLALKGNMVSAAKLEKALLTKEQSQAKYKQVSSDVNELEHRINRLKFYAPKDGTVVDIFSEPGEYLNQGKKILSFLSASDKEINCQIPVSEFNWHNQTKFNLLTANKQLLSLTRTEQVVENTSQFVNVYLKDNTTPFPQFLGQRLKVEMSITNNKLSRLPVDGLNLSSSGNYAWRINNEGKVSKVPIKLHANKSGYFLVESSLSAGEHVVTLGKADLAENQQVEISSVTSSSVKGTI